MLSKRPILINVPTYKCREYLDYFNIPNAQNDNASTRGKGTRNFHINY